MNALRRNPALAAGAVLTLAALAIALVSLWWTPYPPASIAMARRLRAPSALNWLGTDHFGRDLMSMMMVGMRNSLAIALAGVALGGAAGAALGLTAVAMRGLAEEAMMRAMDFVFAFPAVLAAIIVMAIMGPGSLTTVVAIAVANVAIFARLARAAALDVAAREFVRAAKALGCGPTRIALVHVDDSFGADCATGAQEGFEKAKLQPLFIEKFDRAKPDFTTIVQKTKTADAQAVFLIGSAGAVADGTKMIRAGGSRAQIVTVSNNASGGFIKQMGEYARGTIVTQVFPYERSLSAPIVKEASDLAAIGGKAGIPADLQGCHTAFIGDYVIDGYVPVEAVRKLLADHPPVKGLTLPGMPPGSPGMSGTKAEPFTVYAIDRQGQKSVYMKV